MYLYLSIKFRGVHSKGLPCASTLQAHCTCKPRCAECASSNRKGTNGVSTDGVTATFIFFDRGTFWVLPLTYSYIPKSSQSVKTHYFCSGPISVDPTCPQPDLSDEDARFGVFTPKADMDEGLKQLVF